MLGCLNRDSEDRLFFLVTAFHLTNYVFLRVADLHSAKSMLQVKTSYLNQRFPTVFDMVNSFLRCHMRFSIVCCFQIPPLLILHDLFR